MDLCERIKIIRKNAKISQEDFGNRISISKAAVSRLESGVNNPSEQTIQLICREFNVKENWIRTGAGNIYNEMDSFDTAFNHFGYMMENASNQKKAVLSALIEMMYHFPDDKWDYVFNQFESCLKDARENSKLFAGETEDELRKMILPLNEKEVG